jgi:hypothetical protein
MRLLLQGKPGQRSFTHSLKFQEGIQAIAQHPQVGLGESCIGSYRKVEFDSSSQRQKLADKFCRLHQPIRAYTFGEQFHSGTQRFLVEE